MGLTEKEIRTLEKGIRNGIAGLNKNGIVEWISELIFDLDEDVDIERYLDKFYLYRENALRKFPRQPSS